MLKTALCLGALTMPLTSFGALLINFADNGANVDVTFSGTVDITGGTQASFNSSSAAYSFADSQDHIFGRNGDYSRVQFSSGSTSSTGNFSFATETITTTAVLSSGDSVGIILQTSGNLYLNAADAATYTSGINSVVTLQNVNLSGLGIVDTVLTLANGDTITISAGAAAVPEPSSPITVAFAGMLMFFANRRRKQKLLAQSNQAIAA